jgi:YidC/Oxa1 family membrane protein insertase
MFNLGVAVIILTILLRIVLLPFTILSERGKMISQRIKKDLAEIDHDYINDPIRKKQAIRNYLKKKKIRPWAKAVVLGVQGLVLVLLYQVFLGGINTEVKLHLLYPGITRPDFINTDFFGFDIGQRYLLLPPAIAAGYLFAQFLIHSFTHQREMNKKEQVYGLFFPVIIFGILYLLPSVKSIFILTSLVISSIISMIITLTKLGLKNAKKANN